MNEQADECDEERVNARQPIHSKREIRTKSADVDPRPYLIENGLIGEECARVGRSDAERDHEGHNRGDRYRTARNHAAERFAVRLVLQIPADEPVDNGTGERGEDDYAKKVILGHPNTIRSARR